ncbi:MAG: hypothetical protein WCQ90_06740 [Deltaproteobacteria bacterium]
MFWLRERVVPHVLKILLLFFIVAAATVDDIAAHNIFYKASPTLIQSLNNDDPGDSKRHTWKTPNLVSKNGNEYYLPHLIIKTYLDQASRLLIPATPAIFFQPDRAPPVSSL